jgi:hypothetical protein
LARILRPKTAEALVASSYHRSPSIMPLRTHRFGLVTLTSLLVASGVALPVGGQVIEDVQVIQGPAGPLVPRDLVPQPIEPQPAGTAIIEGMVVSADLGRPVRRVTVRLSSTTPSPPFSRTTDDSGRFRFEGIPAGPFHLTASKPGYLTSAYGERQPGSGRPGTPLSVAAGQHIERLVLPVARGGVLAGAVADDGGEPQFGIEVRAFRFVWQAGERLLRPVGSAHTDDRGSYRIGALPPGEYIVMASPAGDGGPLDEVGFPAPPLGLATSRSAVRESAVASQEAPAGYAPVFFPGTTSSRDATRVTLGTSEERSGLDLQLPFVVMGRISGSIVADGGAPAPGTEVRLIDVDLAVPGFGLRVTGTNPDGRFTFENVPPGRYRVLAHSGPRNQVFVDQSGGNSRVTMKFTAVRVEGRAAAALGTPAMPEAPADTQWAAVDVALSGPGTEAVTLVLQPGVTVSGRVLFDGSDQPPADLSSIRVLLNSATSTEGPSSAMAQVNSDGQFTITGVTPGTYRVVALSGSAWRPKSFDVGGRDALDFLLTVEPNEAIADARLTMTTKTASLSGTLVDGIGRPAPAHTIVLFADDAGYWTPHSRRIHATRPSTDGRFSVGSLPAGAYRLVAVDDLEDGRWFDPELLRQLATVALPITLSDGEQRTQDLRVGQ